MNDKQKYKMVRNKALSDAGGMVSVQAIFLMLDALAARYGENFTIDGACSALDQLAKMAELTKAELCKIDFKQDA